MALVIRRWSRRGGNERVAAELAEQLSTRGHEVRAVFQERDGTASVPARTTRVLGLGFDPTLAAVSFAWSARRAVAHLRAARAVDVVLGFNHSIEQDVYRLGGGTHAEYLARTLRRGRLLDRVALRLERARLKRERSQSLVAPSRGVAEELRAHYGIPADAVEVIPNGVDHRRFVRARDGQRAEARAEFGLDHRPVAVFVGHDLRRKGFDVAVAATARAGVRLLVASGARRPPALPCHVVWIGARRDIERVYAAADVLVLPTLYDPFGGVVLEALAAGLPVVATARVGACELIADRSLLRLLVEDPRDVEEVMARLRFAVKRPADSWSGLARTSAAPWTLSRFAGRMEDVLLRNVGPEIR